MIDVSPSQFFLIPLVLHLGLVFVYWMVYCMRAPSREAHRPHSRLYRCAVCDHVYADRRDLPMARCSRCGNLNEAIRR